MLYEREKRRECKDKRMNKKPNKSLEFRSWKPPKNWHQLLITVIRIISCNNYSKNLRGSIKMTQNIALLPIHNNKKTRKPLIKCYLGYKAK